MIVNWKKENAGCLVLPCMKNGKITKQIFIVPGYNEVPDDEWLLARAAASRHMASGVLEELKKEETEKKPSKHQEALDEMADLLHPDNFPYALVTESLKKVGIYDKVCTIKKKETGKKILSKDWLIDYMTDQEEDWIAVKNHISSAIDSGEEELPKVTAIELKDLDTRKATAIINETYNLTTLETWKEQVSQPDLRVLIMNQIEEVCKPQKGNRN